MYRLYRGISGKSPDTAGYAFWTQKLAGDRVKATELDLTVSQTAKMGSDTAFVKAVYRNMLKREATDKEMLSWRDKLKAEGNKKLTRQKMIVQFAVSSEAIRKNQTDFNAYIARVPAVNVVQNAANDQKKRFNAMLKDYQQPNKSEADKAAALVVQAQKQLDAANAKASKKQADITSEDLGAIRTNQSNVEGYYSKAQTYATDTANRAAAAQRLYARSKELANYALDIKGNAVYGITKIGARATAAKQYATAAAGKPKLIKDKINAISGKYAAAIKKYEAEQARLEQIRLQHERDQKNADWLKAERARLDKLPLYGTPKTKACVKNPHNASFRAGTASRGGSIPFGTPIVYCDDQEWGITTPDYLAHPICPPDYYPMRWKVSQNYQYYYCKRN